ncbi:hypothetical protein [Amycolatopsis sp. FDAARGOS 1241]|uniref:Rv1733c family protein n=1 Tax=Amycolatopsis sp. FDAARGOS 1241 TaxID=2778070 RepID=UPI0019511CB3|nr:hypothetical protein [Amycolatopsis sp. FDAARGOS 1241]QRP49167.1 hypothetical protein I6J71_16115 [Amycolatopsis sp. FDAARGOS 1241]
MSGSAEWFRRMGRTLFARHGGLARPSDRFQAVVLAVFVVLALVAVPIAVGLGSGTTAQRGRQAAEEAAARHQVPATLLVDASPDDAAIGPDGVPAGPSPRDARWRLPGGGYRVAKVDADLQLHAGETVPIWVDRAGNLVPPPLERRTAVVEGVLTGFGVWAGSCAALALLYGGLVLGLDRHRLKRWQHEWIVELDRRTPS